jgi:hypothetical protein
MIGKIEKVHLREIWEHEAHNFTEWLENNLDIFKDVIDFKIINPKREHGTENFRVDLVAEDESGNKVVIENQLEKSNHDHLGKVITYLASVDATKAIWIVSEPRQEHIKAVSWLNESGLASFYLLKIEGIKIGDSNPAPLLTLIVGPSETSLEAGETKKNYTERNIELKDFWKYLLNKAKAQNTVHSNISPRMYHWLGTSSGISGINYNYTIGQHEGKIEVYIDRGKDGEINLKIFESLFSHKDQIEKSFGGPLVWEEMPGKRACRIAQYFENGGFKDVDKWEEITEEMIKGMTKMIKVFDPYLNEIKKSLSL